MKENRGSPGGATSAGAGRWIWGLIAAGTLIRLVITFATPGNAFDMHSVEIVRQALAAHGIDAYQYVNIGNFHWPYLPVYFGWIAAAGAIAGDHTHLLHSLFRLPAVFADGALAWIVQDYLRRRGGSDRTRVIAAGLVALGPVFIAISSYHGQIDSVAILPGVLAFWLWDHSEHRDRALLAGALIGLGGAIKTTPLLLVLALVPTVRSRRELVVLVSAAIAVPVLVTLPFFVATPSWVEALRSYHGVPGAGGISLALQPDLAQTWILGAAAHPAHFGSAVTYIDGHAGLIGVAIAAVLAAILVRHRTEPVLGAVLLWLATFALAPGFLFQYLVWGLPFFLMAGYLRATAVLQLALVLPMVLFYASPWGPDTVAYVYIVLMLGLWAIWLVAMAVVARGILAGRAPADLRLRQPRLRAA